MFHASVPHFSSFAYIYISPAISRTPPPRRLYLIQVCAFAATTIVTSAITCRISDDITLIAFDYAIELDRDFDFWPA